MFYLYILKSKKFGTYYIGISNNVEKRFKVHNNGLVRSTKYKRPWSIIYKESFSTLSKARKKELYLKSFKSRKSIEDLIKHF